MLQSTQKFEKVISLYVQANNMGMILQDDWDVCNATFKFFKINYTASNDCFGVYYPTTQLVIIHIYHIANNFKEHRDLPIFKDACVEMKTTNSKY